MVCRARERGVEGLVCRGVLLDLVPQRRDGRIALGRFCPQLLDPRLAQLELALDHLPFALEALNLPFQVPQPERGAFARRSRCRRRSSVCGRREGLELGDVQRRKFARGLELVDVVRRVRKRGVQRRKVNDCNIRVVAMVCRGVIGLVIAGSPAFVFGHKTANEPRLESLVNRGFKNAVRRT